MSANNCFDYSDLESQVSFGGSRKKKKRRRSSRSAQTAPYSPAGGPTRTSTARVPEARVVAATTIFAKNYLDLQQANTRGSDKYFHCKANAEASQLGLEREAKSLSSIKEILDFPTGHGKDSGADQAANRYGREMGRNHPNTPARDLCSCYRPNGLSERY